MRSSYTKLYVHFIWSTWNRYNLIDTDLEPILFRLITDKLLEHKCQMLKVGCTEDHIHILVEMHPTVCVSILTKALKGYTSFIISNHTRPEIFFRWQGGYGAITVSPSAIKSLSLYIANQKEHHMNNVLDYQWELGVG